MYTFCSLKHQINAMSEIEIICLRPPEGNASSFLLSATISEQMAAQTSAFKTWRGIIPGATSCLSDVIKVKDAGGCLILRVQPLLVSHQKTGRSDRNTFEFWGCVLDDEDSAASFQSAPGWLLDRHSFWISPHKVFAAITQFRGEILQTHGPHIFFYVYLCTYLLFWHKNPKKNPPCLTSNVCQCPTGEMMHKQTLHSNMLY